MTRLLGVDVGEQHFGIAIADGPLATPLPSLHHLTLQEVARKIIVLSREHQTETIILGLPEGKIAALSQQLAHLLSQLSPLPVILHSESLSTQDAVKKLRAAGNKRKKLQNDHSYAACLILEDYLESRP